MPRNLALEKSPAVKQIEVGLLLMEWGWEGPIFALSWLLTPVPPVGTEQCEDPFKSGRKAEVDV